MIIHLILSYFLGFQAHAIPLNPLSDDGVIVDVAGVIGDKGDWSLSDLNSIRQVSGPFVLIDDKVLAWRKTGAAIDQVPPLVKPSQISAVYSFTYPEDPTAHACAIDVSGAVCWGNNRFGQLEVPPLVNPSQTSVYSRVSCALDEEAITCWGLDFGSGMRFSFEKRPVKIWTSLGNDSVNSANTLSQVCGYDNEGVTCWLRKGQVRRTEVSGVLDFVVYPAQRNSPSRTCAMIQEDQFRKAYCGLVGDDFSKWRGFGYYGDDILPTTTNCKSGGYSVSCTYIKCSVCLPETEQFAFSVIPTLTAHYTSLPVPRAQFLKGIEKMVRSRALNGISRKDLVQFTAAIVSPVILTMDSEYYQKKGIAQFINNTYAKDENDFNIFLKEGRDVDYTRSVALTSIQLSLQVAKDFMNSEDQHLMQTVLRSLGAALTQPMQDQKIKDALQELNKLAGLKQKLASTAKISFAVNTWDLAADWLGDKVHFQP